MADLAAIIDALAADLATVSLPTHNVRLYIPPAVVSPELCPMLSLAPGGAQPDLLSTTEADYENHDPIVVSWFEDFSEVLTSGNFTPAHGKLALQRADLIKSRLKTYSDGIPGLSGESEATIEKYRYGMTQAQGGIWVFEATLSVTTWEL